MIIDRQFREIVSAELEAKGWTHAELARRMGVTRSMVSQYLGEHRASPGLEVVEKFFRALDLEPVLGANPVKAKPKRKTA